MQIIYTTKWTDNVTNAQIFIQIIESILKRRRLKFLVRRLLKCVYYSFISDVQ